MLTLGTVPLGNSQQIARSNSSLMATQPILQFPAEKATKEIPCGKCGQTLQVSARVVMAFCRDCSAGMGVKR